ncbi:attachment p12 family protein [Mobilisporobacter senegalensis]|uniref:Attachment p12 family protein n=1 Tax=Mobilisporobacter senegalensis TaxID=1329262 RepID=A0A3N1XMU7_9FIRM|nr:FeoB-associated Cys-rich membrane protein [Mobilisporobacter senegalensis]ROR26412.1 attachment p12 family protein [Mobilisporobacter senegalensis]
MAEIIIVVLIVLYTGFIIYKKAKDMKKGKFCNCGRDDCPSATKCRK